MDKVVSIQVPSQLINDGGEDIDLQVGLYYEASRPYEVSATFHTGKDSPVEWVFGRELLFAGITRESGQGDVMIRPCPESPSKILQIRLRSPYGVATFKFLMTQIESFLRSTYLLVPLGEEYADLDLDSAIVQFIGNSA